MQSPEKRILLAGLPVALLCLVSYGFFDRQAVHFSLSVDPEIVTIFSYLTEGGDALYPLLTGVIAFMTGRFLLREARREKLRAWSERVRVWGLFLFAAVAASGLLCNLIKMGLGRARPAMLLTENLYGFYFFEFSPSMTSFPSGHSNTAAATALVLWYLWPKSWPFGILLTGSVLLSRVVLVKHFPADTLAGAYLALVTTYYVHRYFAQRYPGCFQRREQA